MQPDLCGDGPQFELLPELTQRHRDESLSLLSGYPVIGLPIVFRVLPGCEVLNYAGRPAGVQVQGAREFGTLFYIGNPKKLPHVVGQLSVCQGANCPRQEVRKEQPGETVELVPR